MFQSELNEIETCECTEPVEPGALEVQVAQDLSEIFRALSDPTRLRIISMLAGRELCVNGLVAALGMSQSAISHQLKHMREKRLLAARREGRFIYYKLDDQHIQDLYHAGLAHVHDAGDGLING